MPAGEARGSGPAQGSSLPLHPAHTPTLEVPYSEPFSSALARTTGQQPHNTTAILGSSSVFLLRMQSLIHLLMHAFIPVCAFIHACIIHVCAPSFICTCITRVCAFIHVCTPSSVHTCILLCAFIHSRACIPASAIQLSRPRSWPCEQQ